MSSKADDFDVRYRDGRDDRGWGNGADEGYADGDYAGNDHGVLGGTVDYDLGYDANGWDTQGFRSPTAGYLDNHETAQLGSVGTARRPRNGHGNGHGRGDGHESGAATGAAAATRGRPAPSSPARRPGPRRPREAPAPGSRASPAS